ncbi:PLC-like phosphodiesterase [Sporodiniella umbellata]|nr:PLC-like phosphodiesterase [Sporodiniella umbellata]
MELSVVDVFWFLCITISLLSVVVNAECNGGSHLCNWPYSNITHLVTHDSYAVSPNLAATQEISVLKQLDDGVRGIKLSAVFSARDSSVHLCHSFCEVLDAGPASDTLDQIAFWLESNTREVVTIMWNNLYNIDASDIARSYEASSILPYVFIHKEGDPWPTLHEMIQSGKRVVNFIDSKPNEVDYPWLMYQFARVFETPYENTKAENFNCNIDRVASDVNPSDLMYVMNHFLYGVIDIAAFKIQIPMRNRAETINGQLLIDHTNNCTLVHAKKPSFIEVDFYTVGEALQLTAELNNAEFLGIKSEKIESHLGAAGFHVNSLSPTKHVEIDNTENSSPSLFEKINIQVIFAFLVTYLYLIAV